MGTSALLRTQVNDVHNLLRATVGDISNEQVNWQPGGEAHSSGATIAHAVLAEDHSNQMMYQGKAPLFATDFAGRTGVSEMPPQEFAGWGEWAKRVTVDLSAFNAYAASVFAATEAYIGSLSDIDLEREVDFTFAGFGMQSLTWAINTTMIVHTAHHAGEVAAVKGLQSLRGYPV